MSQEKDFWTDRRIRIAAEKWQAGEKIIDIASDFDCSITLVASLINRRRDLFPERAGPKCAGKEKA
ncbi:hypothetical protein [Rhizobium hidalgonense]|uniref:hypothetical protein n=1 Tax=Rhizobium hidalgonense TaxID=1538159 RepID=UPI0028729106|nr:hypothetical protein [Rhizobium hidalgonense]MDR9813096.1 hypothetical protein [Rhizobium hidalgonense]